MDRGPDLSALASGAPLGTPLGTRPLLLLVCDDPARQASPRATLHRDYQLLEEHTGREGLRTALIRRPALILMDVTLPDYSGIDICRILCGRAETRSTPIVFVSVFNDAPTENLAFTAGASDYLNFPVSGPTLLHRVAARLRTVPAEDLVQARAERTQAVLNLQTSFDGTVRALRSLLSRDLSRPGGFAAAAAIAEQTCSFALSRRGAPEI
jgi:DNA-binding response OmpR family regulator